MGFLDFHTFCYPHKFYLQELAVSDSPAQSLDAQVDNDSSVIAVTGTDENLECMKIMA